MSIENEKSTPLHFGNMLWQPAAMSKTDNGEFSVSKELEVKPRFIHITGAQKKLSKYNKRIGKRTSRTLTLWAGSTMVADLHSRKL